MIYEELVYEHEADIFANQQKFVKPLSPYEVFLANLEAGNDDQLIIRDPVSYTHLRHITGGIRTSPERIEINRPGQL